MAIYHLSGSVISRSQGQSAVACAAYRSASELHDNKYEKTHDYTHKQDVAFAEILLPENALVWMKDREKLWNAVEAGEHRKDAQLAREIQISLPRELSKEQNIELAREYIQKEFVDRGMVADWAMHIDKSPDGELQPHVHVMLTMREITQDGFGQKNREWNRKENLLMWREDWAEVANRHLSLNGHDIQIDHRSNAERGIELEPQHKIGASVARDRMVRLEDHKRIAFENGEKIFSTPTIALDAITRQQSTFTQHDLARFVNRHTVDAEQFERVYEKAKASDQIIALGMDDEGRERFTTRDMLTLEKRMLEHGNILIDRPSHEVSENAQQRGMIGRNLSEEQRNAYEYVLNNGDLKCVVGYAGTGKSYLLGAAREAWEAEGYRVHGATLSGIAAENLEASSGIESRTLASRMYYWDKGEELLTSKDILVVDEAGMLGSKQMERLLHEVNTGGAKVILIGDPQQLQAIEAGAAFRAISECSGYMEITEIRRQQHEWQRAATREFAQGKVADGLLRYRQHQAVHEFETQAVAKKALADLWNDVRINHPDKTQIMLAYTRKDVQELNSMARMMRYELGELGVNHILQTSRGEKVFAEYDRVYFLQNDRSLGVKNGSLGTIERIAGEQLTIRLDRESSSVNEERSRIEINLKNYNQIDHGYAATVHKAQSLTVDRSYVLASRHMDSHATYVGMSRHREGADLFYSREEFVNERALYETLSRDRSKDVTLDYLSIQSEFARARNIEVSDSVVEKVQSKSKERLKTNERHEQSENKFELHGEKEKRVERQRETLEAFKARYEASHPELAQMHREALLPSSEKLARDQIERYEQLQKQLEQGEANASIKAELKAHVKEMVKQPQTMEYLKAHREDLYKQVKEMTRSRERSLERDLGRSL